MKREDLSETQPAAPAGEQVEWLLAQIEHSRAFRSSPRHRALLRHLVDRSLVGDHSALKETVLAVEVFGRPAARFDPKVDSIVRVETRRLRRRLADYFREEGRDAPLRITLPVGSYVPLITPHAAPAAGPSATRRARDLAERGEHFLRQPLSRETLDLALARFDEALRESPRFAAAHAGRGRALFNLAVSWHRAPREAAADATAALCQALALDERQASAHALLAALQHQFHRDWPAAQRSFRRAIELAPDDAFVLAAHGCHLIWRDETDAAEAALLRARQLDPQYVNARRHLINLRLRQDRLDEARAEIDAMSDLAPGNMILAGLYAVLAMRRRDLPEAIRQLEAARAAAPDFAGVLVALAGVQAMSGRLDVADALMQELRQRFGDSAVSPYVTAIYQARRGLGDEAMATLRLAIETQDPNAVMIATDMSFEPLHGRADWPALVRQSREPPAA